MHERAKAANLTFLNEVGLDPGCRPRCPALLPRPLSGRSPLRRAMVCWYVASASVRWAGPLCGSCPTFFPEHVRRGYRQAAACG